MGLGEAVLGLATIGLSYYQQREQRKAIREGEQAQRRQARAQESMLKEQRDRMESADERRAGAALAARDRQRALAAGAQGVSSTVRTSPLGLPGEPSTTASGGRYLGT